MAGIYIHIPFCKQACHYCDFHFSTNLTLREKIVEALVGEIQLQRDYLRDDEIKSLYFGGGTPSLLTPVELQTLIDTVYKTFTIADAPEVTLEANPDDLTRQKLDDMRIAGINRLSIGIQSLDDAILKSLNRAHNSQMAIQCLDNTSQAGFQNVSVDLIYAIPEQNDTQWEKNIEIILGYQLQHLSCYALTIEANTVFGRWASQGKLAIAGDDFAAGQMEILVDRLEDAGYLRYEVSNFTLPGFESRHNSSYWKGTKYLGIGPSAHSFNGVSRQHNVLNNHGYLVSIANRKIPAVVETLTREDKINEYLLTTLRTSWGSSLKKLREEFSFDLLASNVVYLQSLQDRDLARLQNDTLYLTRAGMLHADKIAADLFVLPV
jgi:oxygen-independent coproporphyrinogen-3 oxidase